MLPINSKRHPSASKRNVYIYIAAYYYIATCRVGLPRSNKLSWFSHGDGGGGGAVRQDDCNAVVLLVASPAAAAAADGLIFVFNYWQLDRWVMIVFHVIVIYERTHARTKSWRSGHAQNRTLPLIQYIIILYTAAAINQTFITIGRTRAHQPNEILLYIYIYIVHARIAFKYYSTFVCVYADYVYIVRTPLASVKRRRCRLVYAFLPASDECCFVYKTQPSFLYVFVSRLRVIRPMHRRKDRRGDENAFRLYSIIAFDRSLSPTSLRVFFSLLRGCWGAHMHHAYKSVLQIFLPFV